MGLSRCGIYDLEYPLYTFLYWYSRLRVAKCSSAVISEVGLYPTIQRNDCEQKARQTDKKTDDEQGRGPLFCLLYLPRVDGECRKPGLLGMHGFGEPVANNLGGRVRRILHGQEVGEEGRG